VPRGAKPGERRGGRAKGVPNRASQARQKRVAETGITPLEVMLENMRFAHSGAQALVERLGKAKKLDGEAFAAWRELIRLRSFSQDCAKEAAPYVHPKLTSVEHTTPPDNPMRSEVLHKLDLASAKIIEQLIK
jgi:hypothetical protein